MAVNRMTVMYVASLLTFAALAAAFPGHYIYIIVGWIGMFFGATVIFGVRNMRRMAKAALEIRKTRQLLKLDQKDVQKAMEKDKELQAEYRSFAKQNMRMLLYMMLAMVLILTIVPTAYAVIYGGVMRLVGNDVLARFVQFVAVFGIFALVFRRVFRPPTAVFPTLVKQLEVHESGIILNGVQGYRAPLHVEYVKVNRERRFIEFKTKGSQPQRIRIYVKDPEETWKNHLSRLVKAENVEVS